MKIFCQRSQVPEGCDHVPLLDPFWGFARWDPEGNHGRVMAEYAAQASGIFEIATSMQEADAALVPVEWTTLAGNKAALEQARDFMREAECAGKKAIIFFSTDAPLKVDWPANAMVFRIAVHRKWRKENEFIVPQWSRDYLKAGPGGGLKTREKTNPPVVTFCGYAPPLRMPFGKEACKEALRLAAHYMGAMRMFPTRAAHAARARALIALSRSPLVKTDFLIRNQSAFNNPTGALLPGGSVEKAAAFRGEFVRNMVDGDYVLCARGYANCSIRFYEALSVGRIPVLVDTDCALPYEFAIDWKKHCVFVDESDISRIGDAVKKFHDALTDAEFEELQRANRRLYEQWFSPQGFFRNMHRHPDARLDAVPPWRSLK